MTESARPHPHLSTRREGPVLTVTLDDPERRNAQTPSLWLALAEVARTVPAEVRVVVLRGAGPSFSAGLDRRMLAPGGVPGEPDLVRLCVTEPDAAADLIAGYQAGFTAWRESHAVVLAVVQGHAVGAGFQLALGADLRLVTEDAQFLMAETSLGLVPDLGGTQLLVAALGYARALEVCATRRSIGAPEAVATGLATLAVPAGEVEAATTDLVEALLAAPAASLAATKTLLARAAGHPSLTQWEAERVTQVRLIADLARRLGGPTP